MLTAPDVQTAMPKAVQKLNRFLTWGVWLCSTLDGAWARLMSDFLSDVDMVR